MSDRLRALVIAHGALVFLAGLLAGFPFAFFELGKIALWPLVGEVAVSVPGDTRAWRMAHLEGILNGLVLFAVAAIAPLLRLRGREPDLLAWSLVVTAWGNTAASILGPISGARGLELGGGVANSAMFLLFVAAMVGVIAAVIVVLHGALRHLREAAPPAAATRRR
jgi:hypothetical protein